MIRSLSAEMHTLRGDFLRDVRQFFFDRNYLEIETPLLNPTGNIEAFMDPLQVVRSGIRKSPEDTGKNRRAFLITSPEYNMKIALAQTKRSVFQIAHCFREGETGRHHTEEFLMLEWYRPGFDEMDLMKECADLLRYLAVKPYSKKKPPDAEFPVHEIKDLFQKFAGSSLDKQALENACRQIGLVKGEEKLRYDELFFLIFLNQIENRLGPNPQFVLGYPEELASLSRVENGRGRRFELFWDEVELANGYYELKDVSEHIRRFERENGLRKLLGKEPMEADVQFLDSLPEMPDASGVALGLDRLLMVLLDADSISEVSPFL